MKKYIFSVLIALLSLPAMALQQPSQAKAILDKTAAAFRHAGGIRATFSVKVISNGRTVGNDNGTIQLKGEKFMLKTSGMTTWFNGKTQWSYIDKNEEVNVSNPTPDELQQINPYAFLNLYQKGYTYKMGSVTSFRGKAVQEVILTANNNRQDPEQITLYISKNTYEPVYILVQQRSQKERSEITVIGYQTGQKYADTLFSFDKRMYPNAEVIDLR